MGGVYSPCLPSQPIYIISNWKHASHSRDRQDFFCDRTATIWDIGQKYLLQVQSDFFRDTNVSLFINRRKLNLLDTYVYYYFSPHLYYSWLAAVINHRICQISMWLVWHFLFQYVFHEVLWVFLCLCTFAFLMAIVASGRSRKDIHGK